MIFNFYVLIIMSSQKWYIYILFLCVYIGHDYKYWNFLQLERVCYLTSQYDGRPIEAMQAAATFMPPPSLDLDMNIYPRHFQDPMASCTDVIPVPMLMPPETAYHFPEGGLLLEEEKPVALGLAISSMDELVKMCQGTEPLWIRNNENGRDVLNLEEHARMFPWPLNLKNHSNELRTEASRDSAVVIMNSITLVDAFLDAVSYSLLSLCNNKN